MPTLVSAQSTSRTLIVESRVVRRKREPRAYARAMTLWTVGLADAQLVGRDVEAARVDALIERLAEGGAALVVSGEPGVGKSALLLYARARADALGFRTLTTEGVESEAELAFAGLHQLLVPVLELVELVPAPQRRALEVAFGIAHGPEPGVLLLK